MTMKLRDAKILFAAGFTKREIEELNAATDPKGNPQPAIDLSSPAWQATLAKRRNWSDSIRAEYAISHNKFMTRQLYNQVIDQWYDKGRNRTPWDWIKATYRRDKKIGFINAVKRRAQRKITSLKKEFGKLPIEVKWNGL